MEGFTVEDGDGILQSDGVWMWYWVPDTNMAEKFLVEITPYKMYVI